LILKEKSAFIRRYPRTGGGGLAGHGLKNHKEQPLPSRR